MDGESKTYYDSLCNNPRISNCVNNNFNYYIQLAMLYECAWVRHVFKNFRFVSPVSLRVTFR